MASRSPFEAEETIALSESSRSGGHESKDGNDLARPFLAEALPTAPWLETASFDDRPEPRLSMDAGGFMAAADVEAVPDDPGEEGLWERPTAFGMRTPGFVYIGPFLFKRQNLRVSSRERTNSV